MPDKDNFNCVIQPIVYTRGFGGKISQDGKSPTIEAKSGTGGNNQPIICYRGDGITGGEKTFTVLGDHENRVTDLTNLVAEKTYIDAEMEVAVRKYPVDTEKLMECLKAHKKFTNKEISEKLNQPLTLVEHWFRQDEYFAVPDAEIWFDLKELLEITTDEFDESITTLEYKGSNFDQKNRIYIGDKSPTLLVNCGKNLHLLPQGYRKTGHPRNAEEGQGWEETEKTDTLNAYDNTERRTPTVVVAMDRASYNQGQNAKFDMSIEENGVSQPLVAKGPGAVAYKEEINTSHGGFHTNPSKNVANTLEASDWKDAPMVAYGIDAYNQAVTGDVSKSLNSAATDSDHIPCVLEKKVRYIVRRLTPLECERLQGFPDLWTGIGEWTDNKGKKHQSSDSSRYKALGNSIALPQWKWIIKRLCGQYERDATMCSLFDGIGGFPLIWEQINGRGSCVWSSEIEEFPIAVTKKRFQE